MAAFLAEQMMDIGKVTVGAMFAGTVSLWIWSVPQTQASDMKPTAKIFNTEYQGALPVAIDQAQVVYYRSKEGIQRPAAAHVYVDREFHTGLLPGGYSRFCLTPGTHTIGAYLNDAPVYNGKNRDLYQANLLGGQTYYLRVREDGNTFPLPVNQAEADLELKRTRAQVHVLSRASNVEICRHYAYLENDEKNVKSYRLASDILFAPGKSEEDEIAAQGRQAINEMLSELKHDDAQIISVSVTGHTDPMGQESENQLLGKRRAESVGQVLIQGGIAASIIGIHSDGQRDPIVRSCYGPQAQQAACYAPNRRVEIHMEFSRPAT